MIWRQTSSAARMCWPAATSASRPPWPATVTMTTKIWAATQGIARDRTEATKSLMASWQTPPSGERARLPSTGVNVTLDAANPTARARVASKLVQVGSSFQITFCIHKTIHQHHFHNNIDMYKEKFYWEVYACWDHAVNVWENREKNGANVCICLLLLLL